MEYFWLKLNKIFWCTEEKNVHCFRLQILLRKLNIFQGFSYVIFASPGRQFAYRSAVQFKTYSPHNETGTHALATSNFLPASFLQVKSR